MKAERAIPHVDEMQIFKTAEMKSSFQQNPVWVSEQVHPCSDRLWRLSNGIPIAFVLLILPMAFNTAC